MKVRTKSHKEISFSKKEHYNFQYFCIIVSLILIIASPILFFIFLFIIWGGYIFLSLNSNTLYRIKKSKSFNSYTLEKTIEIKNHNNYYKNKDFEKYARKKIFKIEYKNFLIYRSLLFILANIGLICGSIILLKILIPSFNNNLISISLLFASFLIPIIPIFYYFIHRSYFLNQENEYLYEYLPKSTLFYRKLKNRDENSYILSHRR